MRFATYPQFVRLLSFFESQSFPIGERNVSEVVEKHLYDHWKDSQLFCEILPTRKTQAYLEKIFRIVACGRALFRSSAWKYYSFSEPGEYEALFDRYLLEAYTKSPPSTRAVMM